MMVIVLDVVEKLKSICKGWCEPEEISHHKNCSRVFYNISRFNFQVLLYASYMY